MVAANAAANDPEGIPVIDMAPLIDGTDPQAVADALHAASRDVGFIYVRNHGIPDRLIDATRAAAYDLFRSPDAQKARIRMQDTHRGFLGSGGARMQDDVKADLKESFVWGFESPDGSLPDDHSVRGANRWPDFLPELRSVAIDYFDAGHRVAHHLMRGFALGLGLQPQFFLQTTARPLSRASFVYYPPQPDGTDGRQFGVGPHTDFGVLTVLCQDTVGGLEVEDLSGRWIPAPPIPGTLIVNVGDLLARWTDGAYRSTPHRVINRSGRERLSLVLCYDPDPDTIIDARQVFGPGHAPKEAPTTCGDYLTWRFDKAFAYRNKGAA